MTETALKPTVIGTRIGYGIHFTCPDCQWENSIMYNMPKAFYKETREGTCARCKKHFTVRASGGN